uniref:Variant surface glycoprotein 1125.1763 n=1 Tax=Trypanosoma brucei TaxID=5691 RepID=A0A1J0R7N0_9TRYP|nr:variant surface glycoprotein 1125.1763 [Trypanosoma brucei]
MRCTLLLLFITTPIIEQCFGAVTTGNNAEVAHKLCTLFAGARGKWETPKSPDAGQTAYKEMQMLNISLSKPDTKAVFKHVAPHTEFQDYPPDAVKNKEEWKKMYKYWKEAAQPLEIQGKDTNTKTAQLTTELNDYQKKKLLEWLGPVLAEATVIRHKLAEAQTTLEGKNIKDIPSTLNTALVGRPTDDATTLTDTDIWKTNLAGNLNTKCEAAGPTPEEKSLVAVVLCLCSHAGGEGLGKACFIGHTHPTQWTPASGSDGTEWTKYKKLCHGPQVVRLTAGSLSTALASLLSTIEIHSGNAYLGTVDSSGNGNCDGQRTNGICIKFTGAATATANTNNQQPVHSQTNRSDRQLGEAEAAERDARFLSDKLEGKIAAT